MENENVIQEKKDRRGYLNNRMIDQTIYAIQNYLGMAYFYAIGDNLPELMKVFLENDGAHEPLVVIDRIIKYCSDDTIIAIRSLQVKTKEKTPQLDEKLLAMISDDIQKIVLPEERLRLVHSMFDMAAFVKLGTIVKYHNLVYPMLLRTFPKMKTQTDDAWKSLNYRGKDVRNDYLGHMTVNAAWEKDAKSWKQDIIPLETICSILRNDDTENAYRQLQKEIADAIRIGEKQIFTFEELAEEAQTTQAELKKLLEGTQYQNECGEYTVTGESKEAILNRISSRKNEEEWKQAQERLEKQKQSQTGMQKEELRNIVATEIAEEKAEEISGIQLLAAYQGDRLNDLCLRELIRTHKIVLSISMLRNHKARVFLGEKLIPFASELIQEGAEAPFLVEASTRYTLFQGVKKYRGIKAADSEESCLSEEAAQAKQDHAAYFLVDHLSKNGYLSFVGIPVPGKDTELALAEYAASHYKTRLCILTCGKAVHLVDEILKSKNRFCIVGRVFDGIRIFPQMLPIPAGKELVKNTIREQVLNHFEQTEACPELSQSMPKPQSSKQQKPVQEAAAVLKIETNAAGRNTDDRESKEAEEAKPDVHGAQKEPEAADEVLPFDGEVTGSSFLYTETGESVQLTGALIENGEEAAGGEGVLYRTDHSNLVAKIYYRAQRTKRRYEKLNAMLQNPVNEPWICWPCSLLLNERGQFAGYLMPQAPSGTVQLGKSLFLLGKPTLHQKLFPDWRREDLVKTAIAITDGMKALHEKHILVGDINPGNILIDPKKVGQVFFVDCDSYQCFGYPCPVGTEEYTHPNMAERLHLSGKLQFGQAMRTEAEEDYCLAILLFKLLNPGQSPFINTSDKDFLQTMKNGDFAFARTDNRVISHSAWMIWKNFPVFLTEAFDQVFRQWKWISAAEWNRYLLKYQEWIKTRNFSNELFPELYHEYKPENPIYQNKTCPLCKKIFNVPKNESDKYKYCFDCGQRLRVLEQQRINMICDVCGKPFLGNMKILHLKETLKYDAVCPSCWNMPCARCGKKADIDIKKKKYLIQKGKAVYCTACNQMVKAEIDARMNRWKE